MPGHYSAVLPSAPAWQPWATLAFQQAQRARRPVLLLLDTAWSLPSRHLRDDVLAAPEVAARIDAQFVAVHVDADWRPDIADRYGLGAWPTLLALTPEGHVLGGGVGARADLADWLDRTARLFAAHDGSLSVPPVEASAPAHPVEPAVGLLECYAALHEAVDPETETFGVVGQPLLSPTLAALACAAAGLHDDLVDTAARTIDRLLGSARWDGDRGLLRCAGPEPFLAGDPVGRLDEQAEWTRVLAHALSCDARPAWRAALEASVEALRTAYRHPARPVWLATRSLSDDAARGQADAPVFIEATARACRALCSAAIALEVVEPAAEAIAALEHVVPAAYSRGAGVAHVLTHRPHGPALLLDATLVAHALLGAQRWRDQPVYRDLADELLRNACSRLAQPDGALADRRATLAGANGVGRLAQPLRPIEANADAARGLTLLSAGEAVAADAACAILRAVHADARNAGGFAAPAVLAWATVLSPEHPISVW